MIAKLDRLKQADDSLLALSDEAVEETYRLGDIINNVNDELKSSEAEDNRKAEESEALLGKGLKRLTEKDLEKVYRAGRSEYSSSYSMMVDDAYRGCSNVAKKLGLPLYWDAGVFPMMFSYIRNHASWDKVPQSTKRSMLSAANEDLVDTARR